MTDTIEQSRRTLAEAARPTLAPSVLYATGLAHGCVVKPTLVGDLAVAFSPAGITACELLARTDVDRFVFDYEDRIGHRLVSLDRAPGRLEADLDRAFATGDGRKLHYDLRGLRPFELAVLQKALEIPAGEIRPYSWIAREIGKPRAVRAVGTALGHNPIPLLIPCHRVVRADGLIGNYGMGGTVVKKALLSSEGLDPDDIEARARKGERFVGSDTTRIYCHPTCRDAKRITPTHRVTFRTAIDAADAGYRPC